jgi:hypothetical protein
MSVEWSGGGMEEEEFVVGSGSVLVHKRTFRFGTPRSRNGRRESAQTRKMCSGKRYSYLIRNLLMYLYLLQVNRCQLVLY